MKSQFSESTSEKKPKSLPTSPGFVDNFYEGIESFNIVKTTDQVLSSRVNVLECSPDLRRKLGRSQTSDFTTEFYIDRKIGKLSNKEDARFPFKLMIMAEHRSFEYQMLSLSSEVVDRKKFVIRFDVKGQSISSQDFFIVQFRFDFVFKSVVRFLKFHQRAQTMKPEQGVSFSLKEIDEEIDLIPVRKDIIKNYYDQSESRSPGIVKGLAGLSQATVRSVQPTGESEKDKGLYKSLLEDVKKWKIHEMYMWFSHIPVITKDHRLLSLMKYIEERDLKSYFDVYLVDGPDPFHRLEGEVMNYEVEGKPRTEGNNELKEIFKHRDILHRIWKHYKILKFCDYRYHPTFYVVLSKQCHRWKNSDRFKKNNAFFTDKFLTDLLESKLLFRDQCKWDIGSLRRKLLFNFLYGRSIPVFIKEMQVKLTKLREENPDWNLERSLEEMKKETNGLELKHLDFGYFMKCEKAFRKKSFKDLRAKEVELKTTHKTCEKKIRETFAKKMEEIKKKITDPNLKEEVKNKFKKILQVLPKKIESSIIMKKKAIEKQINENSKFVHRRKEEYLESNTEQFVMRKNWEFFSNNGEYKTELRRLIENEMNRVFGTTRSEEMEGELEVEEEESTSTIPIFEGEKQFRSVSLTSKLVVCRRMQKAIPYTSIPMFAGVMNFFDPKFLRFGLTHAYLVVCNVAFHWFSTETVFANDLKSCTKAMEKYEDLACFDTQTQFFLCAEDFVKYVTNMCRMVMNWNTNYIYSWAGIRQTQGKYVKNCQEFCLDLLEKMEVPQPFYKPIQNYINNLKVLKHLMKEETGEEDDEVEEEVEEKKKKKKKKKKEPKKKKLNKKAEESKKMYRYIEVWDGFPESIQKKVMKGKERVWFENHKSLDIFVKKCVRVEPEFEIQHPDLFQILKAFDRSFWMAKFYRDESSETNEPLKCSDGKSYDCYFYSAQQ